MKSFYVVTNTAKDTDYSLTNSVVKYLEQKGCYCGFVPFARGFIPGEDKYVDPAMIPEDVEAIIVLGGDGTLLQAARDTYSRSIPIIGVNLGDMGYLTDISEGDVFSALDALIEDRFFIEKRMMLKGTLYSGGAKVMSNIALNDIVISKSYDQRMIKLNINVDDSFLNTIYADGLIMSSPTGSTGYSLSVGGPIIAPDAEALLITPLAPHTLANRSVVLSGESKITIEQGTNKDGASGDAIVVFDGNIKSMMHTGDKVEIEKSETDVKLIKIYKSSFLDVLSMKMR
jgi:NAD+ kinase